MVLTHLFSTPIGNLGLFDSVLYSKSLSLGLALILSLWLICISVPYSSVKIRFCNRVAILLWYLCIQINEKPKKIKNQELC